MPRRANNKADVLKFEKRKYKKETFIFKWSFLPFFIREEWSSEIVTLQINRKRKSMKKVLFWLIVLLAVAGTSCEFSKKYEKEERQLIQDYLSSRGDTVYTKTASGLYYFTVLEGTGRAPVTGDTAYIWYKSNYLTGRLFDSNLNGNVFPFIVGNGSVIKGLDEGICLMKQGGITKFITPSSLAYGAQGIYDYYYGVILPGYTPLVWEIKLDTVRAGSK